MGEALGATPRRSAAARGRRSAARPRVIESPDANRVTSWPRATSSSVTGGRSARSRRRHAAAPVRTSAQVARCAFDSPCDASIVAALLPSPLMSDRRRGPVRTASQPIRARPDEPEGRHLGPIPITATGVLIAIALVLSLAYVGLHHHGSRHLAIPLLASGLVVLGLVFARDRRRSAPERRGARASAAATAGRSATRSSAGSPRWSPPAASRCAVILFLVLKPPAA